MKEIVLENKKKGMLALALTTLGLIVGIVIFVFGVIFYERKYMLKKMMSFKLFYCFVMGGFGGGLF
jgi:hypothetical protein